MKRMNNVVKYCTSLSGKKVYVKPEICFIEFEKDDIPSVVMISGMAVDITINDPNEKKIGGIFNSIFDN